MPGIVWDWVAGEVFWKEEGRIVVVVGFEGAVKFKEEKRV